jgi:hypothetical protein
MRPTTAVTEQFGRPYSLNSWIKKNTHIAWGNLMARKAIPFGPSALGLIEDAPVELVRAVLSLRESDNEPDFSLPAPTDEQSGDAARQQIVDVLNKFDQEDLHPLERRCRRIRMLAEGKGVSSIDTIYAGKVSRQAMA